MPLMRCGTDRPSSEHLNAEVIAAYIDRRLGPAAQAEVEAHLADCAECRREVEWVIRLLQRGRQCALLLRQQLPRFGHALQRVASSLRTMTLVART